MRRSLPLCPCGRPATHLRLVVSPAGPGLSGARLVPEGHCERGPGHWSDHPGDQAGQVVRAAAVGPAGWTDAPVRWPDLETPSLLLALVARWLPVPVLVVDTTASAVFSNRAWSTFSGLSRAASVGLGWQAAIEASVRQATTERVAAVGGRACETAMVQGADPTSHRTRLVMEQLLAFDGSALGKVVWLPELGPPAEPTSDERQGTGLDEWDDAAAAALVAQVQHALDAHQYAATTIAALVIEVDPVPVGDGADAAWEPGWEVGIDQALADLIQPQLGELQTLVPVGHHKLAILCEQVSSYREVIELAELVVRLADDPPCVGGVDQALTLSVGVAFPHLPGGHAETLLGQAIGAAHLARSQGASGYQVVIGTGPGSSDVTRPPAVQEHLSAPSATLQPQRPS